MNKREVKSRGRRYIEGERGMGKKRHLKSKK